MTQQLLPQVYELQQYCTAFTQSAINIVKTCFGCGQSCVVLYEHFGKIICILVQNKCRRADKIYVQKLYCEGYVSDYGFNRLTAGIISLLTHICICVVLNTLVHAQLTYGHQSPCH